MNFEFSFALYQEMLRLSKQQAIDDGDLDLSCRLITECLSRSLEVARASVWLYNENRSAIVCVDLYERDYNRHSSGLELRAKEFPTYFMYLQEERSLAVNDAQTDPATFEFTEPYLKPLGITSMVDVPIRVSGKMIGVLCCEHIGALRNWSLYEESFAGNIGDILTRAFQARERTNAQNELKKVNADLEEIVRQRTSEIKEIVSRSAESARLISLGEMAGGIAHEVNTPLNSILFAAESARELVGSKDLDTEELKYQMALIEETSLRIAKIIQGLKWFAQDQRSQVYELYDLRLIVEQALELCEQKFRSGNVELRWTRPKLEVPVMCQPVQIGQVIINLLNNAYDAASVETNGAWIEIEILDSGSFATIEVSNSGPKIPDELCPKLFEPFFTTKPPGKGTGLGLSLSSGIVKSHGGELRVERDRPNTCFAVILSSARQTAKAS